MIELMLFFGLLMLGAAMVIAFGLFLVKVAFKLLLLPLAFGWFLAKAVAALLLLVFAVVFAPVLLGVLVIVGIPLLLLGGLVGLGALVFSAA